MLKTFDLRGQILRHRPMHTDPHWKNKKVELIRANGAKELNQLENDIRIADRTTLTSRSHFLKRVFDERDIECGLIDEVNQNELAAHRNNETIDDKLSNYIKNEHLGSLIDNLTVGAMDTEPEMYDFARRIRAEATGVLQRFQIIQNEQRRKKQEMDEKEQERCWLEEWIAKDREMEISERLAKFNKMRAFREGLAEQIASQPPTDCMDYKADKKRCEEIIAKELAEIKKEKEAALRRKEELKKTQLETLARHERELHERKRMERDFEEKKRREMESLIASTDVNRYFWASTVDARRKKQEFAAEKLVELRRAEEESLSKQAARASAEVIFARSMLESTEEADEETTRFMLTNEQQAKYRKELDCIVGFKEAAIQEKKDYEEKLDRCYMAACEKQELKRRQNDELRRAIGLEIGKCLRSQIDVRQGELRRLKEAELESNCNLLKKQCERNRFIEKAKQQLLSDFEAWKINLISPPVSDKPADTALGQDRIQKPHSCSYGWTSETRYQFGRWYPGRPSHPLMPKSS